MSLSGLRDLDGTVCCCLAIISDAFGADGAEDRSCTSSRLNVFDGISLLDDFFSMHLKI